jgi:threonine dehydrogenase-like Zn-dependent dehydrogenase
LECSGAPAAARIGLEAIRKQGVYTQIGLFNKPFEVNFEHAYKELSVSGSFSQRWTAWETRSGSSGRVPSVRHLSSRTLCRWSPGGRHSQSSRAGKRGKVVFDIG